MTDRRPVFCALDTSDTAKAYDMAVKVKDHIGGLKIGLEFYMANGASGYRRIAELGLPVFLDVKLHDIPNTVAGAVNSLLALKPAFITIHASGGASMLKAAVEAAARAGPDRPRLLGVTVLTSLDSGDLATVGQTTDTGEQVLRLARLAEASKMDGVICAPAEIAALRKVCRPDFVLMVPGIRPSWAASQDQKRVMTPREAMQAGATHLVVGRPITQAADPAEAARRLNEEMAA